MNMRLILVFCAWLGIAASGGYFGSGRALGEEVRPGHAACVKMALERKQLEKAGVQQLLALPPDRVRAQHGEKVVNHVRHYISLSETVLFKCPANVLNAVAAPLSARSRHPPPLPVKGPRRARQVQKRPRNLVPLPVKRRLPFKVPQSQG